MSFVLGFVTGMSTGEAVERRKGRSQFREYMERRGYTIVDRDGRQVPLDLIVDEALETHHSRSGQVMLVAGAVIVTAVVVTSGSALVLMAVA